MGIRYGGYPYLKTHGASFCIAVAHPKRSPLFGLLRCHLNHESEAKTVKDVSPHEVGSAYASYLRCTGKVRGWWRSLPQDTYPFDARQELAEAAEGARGRWRGPLGGDFCRRVTTRGDGGG